MEKTEKSLPPKTSLSTEELVDKVKGIIYGAAIGDGIGLATEFMAKDQARTLYGNGPIKFGKAEGHPFWRDAFRSGWFENDFSDDTDQMLLILQSILDDNGTINPRNFAFRLSEWCRIGFPELDNKLPRGIGLTVGSTCSHKDFLSDPLHASYDIWNSKERNLAANGALMRTGIVGAPYFWDEKKVVENCMMAAKVTHADPRSVTSAVILTVLISRLLRGSLLQDSFSKEGSVQEMDKIHLTEMIQFGSTDDSSYLDKFKDCKEMISKQIRIRTPFHRSLILQVRRIAARLTGQPMHPIYELQEQFSIPSYPQVDVNRFDNPAPIRENVKLMHEYGTDEGMLRLCKEVVESYSFLLVNNSLCSPEKDWVGELHSHCFPDSLASLKLNERGKIGYTFKCLGAGVYLGTRKIPEDMTSSDFFQNVITELVLETGDADTNCAVAGALLGCRLGKSGLPKQWVEGLRHQKFIENIANDLCEMILKSVEGK